MRQTDRKAEKGRYIDINRNTDIGRQMEIKKGK